MQLFPLPAMNVTAVGRSRLRKPLALALALLVSPLLHRVGPHRDDPRPLEANAQVGSLCTATGNGIIRDYCIDQTSYAVSLIELERRPSKPSSACME